MGDLLLRLICPKNIYIKLLMPQIMARHLVWKSDMYQNLYLIVLIMFSLLKTSKQLILVLFSPGPYPGNYFPHGQMFRVKSGYQNLEILPLSLRRKK